MAMDFWQAQKRARSKTAIYLGLFLLLTFTAAFVIEVAMRSLESDYYQPQLPVVGLSFIGMTLLFAFVQYSCFKVAGGKYVATSMGAILADPDADLAQKQLVNIVEEIAIASSLPVPAVYIIKASEINAFAAGLTPATAVIAVTEGALRQLSRDELQGVVAHEFGHIQNADMLIGLRVAAMVMGFYFILYMGLRLMQLSGRARWRTYGHKEKGNPLVLMALFLFLAGAFTWFFGSILKAMISRQREYLADASSVQFTRNPEGLANALRKIQQEQVRDMPKSGMAYSHLYFDARGRFFTLFATHPPLEKRIDAILGQKK